MTCSECGTTIEESRTHRINGYPFCRRCCKRICEQEGDVESDEEEEVVATMMQQFLRENEL